MNVYKGQKGFTFLLECVLDISGAFMRRIIYRKPSGVTGQWEAQAAGPTQIQFTTSMTVSELDEDGDWTLQPFAKGNGFELSGDVVVQRVHPTLQTPSTDLAVAGSEAVGVGESGGVS